MINSCFNSIYFNLNSWIDLKSNSFKFVDNQKTTLFALPIIGAFGLLANKYYHATREIKKLKQQINQKNKPAKTWKHKGKINLIQKTTLWNALKRLINLNKEVYTHLINALENEINSNDKEIKNRSLKKFTKNYKSDSLYSYLLLIDQKIVQMLDSVIPLYFSNDQFKIQTVEQKLCLHIDSNTQGIADIHD